MKIIQLIGIGLGLTFFAKTAIAQDDDEPKTFSYATYFYCSANGQSRADEIIERGAPLMDELVDNGVISAWGVAGPSYRRAMATHQLFVGRFTGRLVRGTG